VIDNNNNNERTIKNDENDWSINWLNDDRLIDNKRGNTGKATTTVTTRWTSSGGNNIGNRWYWGW
jgi:hypothetical protein